MPDARRVSNDKEQKYQVLLKKREELEQNRPHDVDAMRRWKHSMGKVLQELELYKNR